MFTVEWNFTPSTHALLADALRDVTADTCASFRRQAEELAAAYANKKCEQPSSKQGRRWKLTLQAKREHQPRIRPIETRYSGYRFRSRNEARWAVVFNALDLDWVYEPEGYHLPNGNWYLPDFLINNVCGVPGGKLYVEAKPKKHIEQEALSKLESFSSVYPLYVVAEIPLSEGGSRWYAGMARDAVHYSPVYSMKYITGDEQAAFLGINRSGMPELFPYSKILHLLENGHPWVMNAALLAGKEARFEHGERPEDNHSYHVARETVQELRTEKRQAL